jgi:hypothetical protein
MIPENMKRRATVAALICFGVVLLGALMGAAWVSIYAPR